MLQAPDDVLTERSLGKRIDPVTGGNVWIITAIFQFREPSGETDSRDAALLECISRTIDLNQTEPVL